jgi:acyl-CoA thioester hydrolase
MTSAAMARSHRIQVRVYYEDTDFSGAVYHAAYLHFFERGRTEFLRAEGIHHSELAQDGIAFAVRSMEIDFPRAAGIDDLLVVDTAVVEVSGVRLTLDQSIERGDELIARAKVVVVAVKDGKATRLPKAVVAAFG